MSNDLWLKELAQAHRERETEERSRFDERWDRLSAGTLSPEEDAEFRALAQTSEEARDAYEAFRPLGADFQARVVRKIREQVREQGQAPAPEPEDEPFLEKLLSFWRSTSPTFRWAGWSSAAALAAVALFFMVQVYQRMEQVYPQLPSYALALIGGDQVFRGGTEPATGVPVFSPGSTLTLNAYPKKDVTGPVEAYAFADRGAELVPLELKPQVVNGSVRLRGTLGEEIRLSPGVWRIWVVVGRPKKIPSAKDLQAELRAERTRHADWQAVSKELRVEERQASP